MNESKQTAAWPLYRKITFRFLFTYFILYLGSTMLSYVAAALPPFRKFKELTIDVLTNGFNDHLLHHSDKLSTCDATYGLVQFIMYILLSAVVTAIWNLADRKRANYVWPDYLLRTALRYFVAFIAFDSGIFKLLGMRAFIPSLSDAATPLGEFASMSIPGMVTEYSETYLIFSGALDILVCLLLLYRRTVTPGLIIGLFIFINMMMLNIGYDIRLKLLFSIHMVVITIVLLLPAFRQFFTFFILKQAVTFRQIYNYTSTSKRLNISRLVLKSGFILALVLLIISTILWASSINRKPFAYGVYEIEYLIINNDTITQAVNDPMAWKDLIFDRFNKISINTLDPRIEQMSGRGYIRFKQDSVKQQLTFFINPPEGKKDVGVMKYFMNNNGKLRLQGSFDGDSLTLELRKNESGFELLNR